MTISASSFTPYISAMIQRADPQELIDDAVSRIRGVVRPWRIVLFGSRARGNHRADSDYDLYVEASEEGVSREDLRQRIWAVVSALPFDLKVQPPGEIERRRDDPGTIEWDVAREGRVLFADPAASTALAPRQRVGEPPPGVPESMHEWLEVAERDLRHCRLLREQGQDYSPEVCWYAHQTCEKHMKALLVARRIRPERTHSLTKLLAALRNVGLSFPGLDAHCELLSKFAITPRYPAGLSLGAHDAEIAFRSAEQVVSAVRAELPLTRD